MTTTTKPKLTKIEKTRADSYESHLVWAAQAQIKAERDALAAELAAIKAREPVAWRWRMNGQWHYGPEPLFKDGFTTQEPLYDKPTPPVQEPLSDEEVDALGDL